MTTRTVGMALLLLAISVCTADAWAQGGYFFANVAPQAVIDRNALQFNGGPIIVHAEPCDRPDARLELDIWVFSRPYWPGVDEANTFGYSIATVQLPAPTSQPSGGCASILEPSATYSIKDVQTGANYITYFLRVIPSPSCASYAAECYESFHNAGYYSPMRQMPYPQYRNPPVLPAYHAMTLVVEYYHSQFDHYFLTALPSEIRLLDAGEVAGWARTGYTFAVSANGWSDRLPLCRFFSDAFAPKSSHFYTSNPNECDVVKRNEHWTYEAIAGYMRGVNFVGQCPLGGAPLFRLYNNGMSGAPNHRYTTSLAVRSEMLLRGWISEGTGDLGAIGCASE